MQNDFSQSVDFDPTVSKNLKNSSSSFSRALKRRRVSQTSENVLSSIARLQHNKAQLEFINLLVALLLFLRSVHRRHTRPQRQPHICAQTQHTGGTKTEILSASLKCKNTMPRKTRDKRSGLDVTPTLTHKFPEVLPSLSLTALISFYCLHEGVVKLQTDRVHLMCIQDC